MLGRVPSVLAPRLWAGHLLMVVLAVAAVLLGLWQLAAWHTPRADEARDLTRTDPVAPVPHDSTRATTPDPGLHADSLRAAIDSALARDSGHQIRAESVPVAPVPTAAVTDSGGLRLTNLPKGSTVMIEPGCRWAPTSWPSPHRATPFSWIR